MKVALEAPPQIPFYTNSYRANTTSAVYLGLIMFLQPEPPYNEGMYRPIEIDYGPPGHDGERGRAGAPRRLHDLPGGDDHRRGQRHSELSPTPSVRSPAGAIARPSTVAGVDPRSDTEYVHMMVSCLMCGAGAVGGVMDGWHGVGPQAGLGGGAAGDMELIEYHYPLLVHRYGFATDSANPGEWRGGCRVTSTRSRRSTTT